MRRHIWREACSVLGAILRVFHSLSVHDHVFLTHCDTAQTAAAISFALMAAALHPKEQAAVQQELDTMIGRERRTFGTTQ